MTKGLAFWILMLIWLVFGTWWNWPRWQGWLGSNAFLFILLVLIGWQVFGAPIR